MTSDERLGEKLRALRDKNLSRGAVRLFMLLIEEDARINYGLMPDRTPRDLAFAQVIRDKSLSHGAAVLYFQLDTFAYGKPETAGLTDEVLAVNKQSKRTMGKHLRALVDGGWLRPVAGSPFRYEFAWVAR